MKPNQYIYHIELNTGVNRKSRRHEVNQALMPRIAEILDAAIRADDLGLDDGRGASLPIPGFRLSAPPDGRCLLASVMADDGTVLATFGVAAHARCGAGLWRCLTEIPTPINPILERPQAPWCAVRLRPGLDIYPSAADWLGDLERCIAWAWLDRFSPAQPLP